MLSHSPPRPSFQSPCRLRPCPACTLLLGSAAGELHSTSMSSLNLGPTGRTGQRRHQVWIQFTGVECEARPAAMPLNFMFSSEKASNLLSLQGGTTRRDLPQWQRFVPRAVRMVRLLVDTNPRVLRDGLHGQHDLTIPSGAETGLKLIQGLPPCRSRGVRSSTVTLSYNP